MANGFVTTSPSVRHGASEVTAYEEFIFAQKFTCPGSGIQYITEIGHFAYWDTHEIRLAIFTDDSGNGCPETMVASSESATITLGAAMAKANYTYGAYPELTGGVDYWLVVFAGSDSYLDYLSSSGENTLRYDFGPAWTWPTGADWHTGDVPVATVDLGIYAVYEAAASAAITGTAQTDSITEADVVAGGETIIITLTDDTWIAA